MTFLIDLLDTVPESHVMYKCPVVKSSASLPGNGKFWAVNWDTHLSKSIKTLLSDMESIQPPCVFIPAKLAWPRLPKVNDDFVRGLVISKISFTNAVIRNGQLTYF